MYDNKGIVLSKISTLLGGLRQNYFHKLASRRLPSRRALEYLKGEAHTDIAELDSLGLGDKTQGIKVDYGVLCDVFDEFLLVDSGDIAQVFTEDESLTLESVSEAVDREAKIEAMLVARLAETGQKENPLVELAKEVGELLSGYESFCKVRFGGGASYSTVEELRPVVGRVIGALDDYELYVVSLGESLPHLVRGVEGIVQLSRTDCSFLNLRGRRGPKEE